MPAVTFWWKPGCATNTRQIRLLEAAGCEVEVRDLLSEAWQPAQLARFFAGRAVSEWFNPAAPAIKRGEIEPAAFDAEGALARLLVEPILIRRPLIEVGGARHVGFDGAWLRAHGIELGEPDDGALPQGCSHGHAADPHCATPEP